MLGEVEIYAHATQGRRTTQASVSLTLPDGTMLGGAGEAIRLLSDPQINEAGLELALGRALENLGRRLQRRGAGFVKHADDVRILH